MRENSGCPLGLPTGHDPPQKANPQTPFPDHPIKNRRWQMQGTKCSRMSHTSHEEFSVANTHNRGFNTEGKENAKR